MQLQNISCFVIFLYFPLILINAQQQQQQQTFDQDPYWHKEILDPRGKYQLEWRVDWSRERVQFNVTVSTRGHVALGLSRNGLLDSADIVIGGVAPNGKPYFSDRYGTRNQETVQDFSQDWVLHSAWESTTHTFLSFSRPFDTCDEHDIPINDDSVYVLWAYGDNDGVPKYFENQGSFVTYLRDPDLTPRSILESNQNPTKGVVERIDRNTKRWAIRQQYRIPAKKTTYWCSVHKFAPQTPGKHHVIGHNFRINPEAIERMHHMVLARCIPPPGMNPSTLYNSFVGNGGGQECYDMFQPLGPIPTMFCIDTMAGHTIGGKSSFFPDHVGIPIGETNPEEFFILQVHYDNPELRTDITSDIQFDVYYTSKLRENDAGILLLGQNVPGSPSLLLPPGEVDHRIYGHCSESCTRKMIPPQGIKLVNGVLHSHTAGRRLRIQHFRNGQELPWILNDDNYQFNFQPVRLFRKEVTVMPGDQVSIQCYYDTAERNTTTVGGYGTEYEMCTTFLLHYTKMTQFPVCRSEIMSQNYTRRYLAGAQNLTWDQSRLELMAAQPPNLTGMTVSQISDSRYVNWDVEQRSRLRWDHIALPQVGICPSLTEVAVLLLTKGAAAAALPSPSDFATFPLNAHPYLPYAERCSLR